MLLIRNVSRGIVMNVMYDYSLFLVSRLLKKKILIIFIYYIINYYV